MARRLVRRAGAAVLVVVVAAAAGWLARHPLLVRLGRGIVAEDALEPVDVLVVSMANVRACALEVADLHREGVGGRVVVPRWYADRLQRELARLGIAQPGPTELARTILERRGVPPEAITILPERVDGTGTELAAVARWVVQERPASLLYVTLRSHSARAGRRLRALVPPPTRILVRGARYDRFDPETWWTRRDTSREILEEYVRWVNTFLLGDAWRARPEGPLSAPARPAARRARAPRRRRRPASRTPRGRRATRCRGASCPG